MSGAAKNYVLKIVQWVAINGIYCNARKPQYLLGFLERNIITMVAGLNVR